MIGGEPRPVPVDGPDGPVNVPCPMCGGDMVFDPALSEASCTDPECEAYFDQIELPGLWGNPESDASGDMLSALVCLNAVRNHRPSLSRRDADKCVEIAARALDRATRTSARCPECGRRCDVAIMRDEAVRTCRVTVKCPKCPSTTMSREAGEEPGETLKALAEMLMSLDPDGDSWAHHGGRPDNWA